MGISVRIESQRTCPNGHASAKSSDCPTCPICERKRKPASGFQSLLAAPARRALERQGIATLVQFSNYSEKDLLSLHGIGPSSIPRLRDALRAEGLSFRQK